MIYSKKLALFLALFFTLSAAALDLQSARSKGAVKELPTGFIEAVENSKSVKTLVKSVNRKRRAHYEKVAKKNGTDVKTVGAAAAKKIQKKLRQ